MNSQNHHPPRWADRLLDYLCREDYADEIVGDLHEAFYWRIEKTTIRKAKIKFVWEAIKSLKPKNLKSFYHFSLNTMIIRNYIKIAFRTFLKRKSTSFINILGLSLGAASFALIFLYAYQILSFDDHHVNKERIFLSYKERITPNGTQATYDTWTPLKDRLKNDYAQVVESARYIGSDASIIKKNQFLEEEIVYTDESFFKIFSFPILHGRQNRLFANKYSVVISEELALKYFQKKDAIGEQMEIFLPDGDTTMTYEVSAVLREFPENITHQPHLAILLESMPFYPEFANEWNQSFLETYVLLDQKESASGLEAAFPDLIETLWGSEVRDNTTFRLLPFEEYYDTLLGNKSDARTLLLIGLGILLIAAINFMNLSTAQASQRTKEIGLRKVLGAFQGQLRTQFVVEAFVSSIAATLIGIGLVILIIPSFNNFFDVTISLSPFSSLQIVSFCLFLAISLGLLSGSYPAFYLSSIKSIDALTQKIGFGGAANFRNTLVVLQFAIALFLIATTFLIRNQIRYMSDREMGFDSDGILVINASAYDFVDQEAGLERLNTLKNELKDKSYIQRVTMSRAVPTSWTRSFTFVRPDGWNGDPLRMRYTYVDANFFEAYQINLKHGSNFLPDLDGEDQRESVILNEAAMSAFEFSPEDQNTIKIGDRTLNVVGVAEDFNFESLENEVAPTLIFHRTASNPVHAYISCKMQMSNLQDKLGELEDLWNELGSTSDFTFTFMDDNIQELYEAEQRYLGLVTLFSTLSILVACLGLYGLTLFVIEKRRKEISIRKVLGAEIAGILRLIFRDFTKWVAIAFVLSVPFVIYFVNDWLMTYHYRIGITWVTFALTLSLVLGLVILTVGYHSLKAAISNPVKYLKDE